jgi:hypothetical protein
LVRESWTSGENGAVQESVRDVISVPGKVSAILVPRSWM